MGERDSADRRLTELADRYRELWPRISVILSRRYRFDPPIVEDAIQDVYLNLVRYPMF